LVFDAAPSIVLAVQGEGDPPELISASQPIESREYLGEYLLIFLYISTD